MRFFFWFATLATIVTKFYMKRTTTFLLYWVQERNIEERKPGKAGNQISALKKFSISI